MDNILELINIYSVYYKQHLKKDANILDNLNNDNDTNMMLELLYEEIHELKINLNNDKYICMYDLHNLEFDKSVIDKIQHNKIYIVECNQHKYLTFNIVIALQYLLTQNWKDDKWFLHQVKTY